jgi:hypothetical protein
VSRRLDTSPARRYAGERMSTKHDRILLAVFAEPVRANVAWADIES